MDTLTEACVAQDENVQDQKGQIYMELTMSTNRQMPNKVFFNVAYLSTVKHASTVTSVKRSPAHNGQVLALPMFFTM